MRSVDGCSRRKRTLGIYDAFVGMLSIMFNDATADIHFDIGVVYQQDNLVYRPKVTGQIRKFHPMPQPLQYVTGPFSEDTLFPAFGLGNKDH